MQTHAAGRPHAALSFVIAIILGVLSTGCGKSALPPPVTVSYRDSFFGVGKVIQITNNSPHHLYNVRVVGRNFKEVSSASVKATDHLRPGASTEVGWIEFEAWVPIPGETVEVYCDDYVTPCISVIPEETE